MITNSMSTGELLAILFISTCFLIALVYIMMEEKEEAEINKTFNYFKTWKW